MCEFCSVGPRRKDRDSTNPQFAGFFSADAIDAAVRVARRQESNRNRSSATNKHGSTSVLSESNHEEESSQESSDGEGDADSDGT